MLINGFLSPLMLMSPSTFPPSLILLVSALMNVLLPHPLGPIIAVIVPLTKLPVTPCKIFCADRREGGRHIFND